MRFKRNNGKRPKHKKLNFSREQVEILTAIDTVHKIQKNMKSLLPVIKRYKLTNEALNLQMVAQANTDILKGLHTLLKEKFPNRS